MTFTKGKWGCGYSSHAIYGDDNVRIATVETERREWGANYDLISAAPLLFEACSDALLVYEARPPEERNDYVLNKMREAITKAKGLKYTPGGNI